MLRHIVVSYDSSNAQVRWSSLHPAVPCTRHQRDNVCMTRQARVAHMLDNCANNYTTMTQIIVMHKTAQRSRVHGSPTCEQLPCSAWPCWPAHGFWPWPGLVCQSQVQANMHASSRAKRLHKSKLFAQTSCSNKCSQKQMLKTRTIPDCYMQQSSTANWSAIP